MQFSVDPRSPHGNVYELQNELQLLVTQQKIDCLNVIVYITFFRLTQKINLII